MPEIWDKADVGAREENFLLGHHVTLFWLVFKLAFIPGSVTGKKSVINYCNLKGS